jgi:hypothetical protein
VLNPAANVCFASLASLAKRRDSTESCHRQQKGTYLRLSPPRPLILSGVVPLLNDGPALLTLSPVGPEMILLRVSAMTEKQQPVHRFAVVS